MKIKVAPTTAALLALLATGCDIGRRPSPAPQGAAAYEQIPAKAVGVSDAAIQPGDRLAIRVMGEPDLTSENYYVDASGLVQMPLAGEIKAGGLTTGDVRHEIVARLSRRYVRDPQVAVSIVDHAKQSVTVEGEVQAAGRFEASPNLTLIGALALARSTTINAKLDEVVVFRELQGKQLLARFNVNDIRSGRSPDPQIIAGDRVVVGRSVGKSAWHDLLQAAPLFNVFYLVGTRI